MRSRRARAASRTVTTRALLAGRRKASRIGMPSPASFGRLQHAVIEREAEAAKAKKRERRLELKKEKERAAEADRVAALYDSS